MLGVAAPAWAQGGGNPSFNLVNRGSQPIEELYATPTGYDRWGQDRLGRNDVLSGQTFPVRLPADGNCSYDIRVVYADRKSEERRRVDLCAVQQMAFPAGGGDRAQAPADDPSFRLVNRGRAEVQSLYVSPSSEQNWGEDRLGDDTVSGGGTRVIRMPPGQCIYDVRAVFANGQSSERRKLNLCSLTELRVP